jgi:hypothetical protein
LLVGVAAVVLGGSILVGAGVGVVFRTASFSVTEVRAVGNRRLGGSQVRNLSGIQMGQSMFALAPREIERRLERIPCVQEARLTREFPHTVVIRIEERRPCLALRDRRTVVDDEGTVFLACPDEADTLPLLVLPAATCAGPGERVGGVSDVVRILAGLQGLRGILGDADSVCLQPGRDLLFFLGGGRVMIQSSGGDHKSKAADLRRVLQETDCAVPFKGRIDLRFQDQVVTEAREEAGRDSAAAPDARICQPKPAAPPA